MSVSKTSFYRNFSTILVALFFLISNTFANSLNKTSAYKVISIEGNDLPFAKDKNLATLSLAAIFDGEVESIPFQFDEYNAGGAVYFEGWGVPLKGKRHALDSSDRLLFIYKDAGPRREKQRFDGKVLAEIELHDDTGEKRYVYLLEGSRLRSDDQYVRYSAEDGLVETDFYSIAYDSDNHLIWNDFSVFSFEGVNPLDEMKIRWHSGILTSLSVIDLTNENIVAKPKGVHIGPIRNTTQLELTLYWLNMPLLTASLQLHHYPQSIMYDMRVITPEIRRAALIKPQLSLSVDGNKLIGAKVLSALGPNEFAIVDGSINQTEKNMIERGVTKNRNWLYLSTQKQFDVVAFFDFLGGTDEPLSLVYEDDLDIQESSERYAGHLPNLGYSINNFPESGAFAFAISLYLNSGNIDDPNLWTRSVRKLPDIYVYPSATD